MTHVDCYLAIHTCKNRDRVLLKLNEFVNDLFETGPPAGHHFVYVTGESSAGPTDWNVFDPGWDPKNTSPPENLSTLSGHWCGIGTGFTTSNGNFHCFEVAEAETYRDSTSSSRSALNVKANSPVELLLADPTGNRLGNLQPGTDVFEIPLGSYSRDFPLADDTGTGPANGDPTGIKTAYVPVPKDGTYNVTVTGTALGTYTLEFRAVATDGTVQDMTAVGVTNVGSVSTYQVAYSAVPGSLLTSTRTVPFQTALDDISNMLQLRLVDNRGIANSLSQKINAAASAAAQGDSLTASNILKAFQAEVNAQSGKHIIGVAPQVLLQDATSLLGE
jgi:hypothetical protein